MNEQSLEAFAREKSVLLSVCAGYRDEVGAVVPCGAVYYAKEVEPRCASLSHGCCPDHEKVLRAQMRRVA